MSSVMGVGNNGGERREEKKLPAHASSRKGCMKGKGGPENASCTFKGVRQRTWGRWVSEIREPKSGSRLWLGTFNSAREAAMAYDAAARRIYGANAHLNLPDEAPLPPQSPPTASQRAVALAAAAKAKYNRVLLEIKMKQEYEKQMQMQMYMLMLHQQHQMQMQMQVEGGILENIINKNDFGENAVGSDQSPFNSNLPEFDDSPMWVEAASTMDYHSQAISDPGIAASTFDDAIGIELTHPLVV